MSATPHETKEAWRQLLTGLGYTVTDRGAWDLGFYDDGLRFVLLPEPKAPTFLHIVLPGVLDPNGASSEAIKRASAIAHDINGSVKVAKLIVDQGVYVSVEAHCLDLRIARMLLPELLTNARLAGHLWDREFYSDAKWG